MTSGQWSVQTLDTQGGEAPSIAIDKDDHIHISYGGDGGTLKYAHYDGNTWNMTVADPELDAPQTGFDTALAVDSRGTPHVAYSQGFTSCVGDPLRGHPKYATILEDGLWWTETIDPRAIVRDMTIGVDSNDRPHIAYYHSKDAALTSLCGAAAVGHIKYAAPLAANAPLSGL